MSQKYVIVHFIDTDNVPEEFPMSEWPLHVTLLANFRIDQLDQLKMELEKFIEHAEPFDIKADGEAKFGPNQSVAVSLIRPDYNIIKLHNDLLDMATRLGAIFDEPAFIGNGYRPHSTIQQKERLQDEQTIKLNNLTLIDMYPNEDIKRRKIIKTFHY